MFNGFLKTIKLAKYRGTTPLDTGSNPLSWWRENESSFPLLARYVKANGAFQATSVASERIFNVDKLVYDDRRKSLGVETGSGLVIAHDFLVRIKKTSRVSSLPTVSCPSIIGGSADL